MRPFKVRVWDGEQMVSPDFVDRTGRAFWKADSIPQSSGKLMWSIGYADKKGADIFEGDIVRVHVKSGYVVITTIVYFPEYGMFAPVDVSHYGGKQQKHRPLGSWGYSTPYRPYTFNSYKSVEVLGNIIQHLYLLEKK